MHALAVRTDEGLGLHALRPMLSRIVVLVMPTLQLEEDCSGVDDADNFALVVKGTLASDVFLCAWEALVQRHPNAAENSLKRLHRQGTENVPT
jgi:hypothetical protein